MWEIKRRLGLLPKRKSDTGFTLIETLLYIALFGVIMSGAVAATFSLTEGSEHTQAKVLIQEEGTFLHRKLDWMLSGASSVSVGAGTMTVTRPDLPAGESPLFVDGTGGALSLRRGATGALFPLSSAAFSVHDVSFSVEPAANGKPTAVVASFRIDGMPFNFRKYLRE